MAPGGYPPGAPTDPDVLNSGIRLLGLRVRYATVVTPSCTRGSAIFRCFVEMGSRLDVRSICPSGSSVHRPPPSLHGVPWGGFPRFPGTMPRLRRLGSPRRFVAFARRFHPDASFFAPRAHGRHAPGTRTISVAAPVDRFSRMESPRPPRFLGNPCGHAPLFDPGGPHDPSRLLKNTRIGLFSWPSCVSRPPPPRQRCARGHAVPTRGPATPAAGDQGHLASRFRNRTKL